MNTKAKTIQILLPHGDARGIKVAELSNRIVRATYIPRNKLEYMKDRDEIDNVGIYFLFGSEEESIKTTLYIGESENCFNRLSEHNKNKEFWRHAIVITSQTKNYTKSHIKYLEHYSIAEAKRINRYHLENSATPKKPHVNEGMESDLLDNFETINTLLSTLGEPVFEPIAQKSKKDIFYCKRKLTDAKGEYTSDGFAVYEGSLMDKSVTKSAGKNIGVLREKLLKEGTVKDNGDTYIFLGDYIFKSPSLAAATVLGRSANGWTEWKDQQGRSLDEVKRK